MFEGDSTSCTREDLFALLAFELLAHPEQGAIDPSAVTGQFDDPGLNERKPSSMSCRVRLRRSTCHTPALFFLRSYENQYVLFEPVAMSDISLLHFFETRN
jgi:hypothetical protein